MSFDELPGQALERLQRRGRVSYRVLKVQFNLDDELLDLLKEEITEVLRVGGPGAGRQNAGLDRRPRVGLPITPGLSPTAYGIRSCVAAAFGSG